jgi:hypothetical protein
MPHKTNSTIVAIEQTTAREPFNVILYDYAPYSAGDQKQQDYTWRRLG